MPNAVRFLFTGSALPKVILASVQVEDVQPGGPAGDVPAGSMRLRFQQNDPSPAQICPLLPGTMLFVADGTAPGIVPDPATSSFTEADVAGWKTRGRILVTIADSVASEINGFAPQLLVKPNRVWYGPVILPPAFFFQTLTAGLAKATVQTAGGSIKPTNPNWFKHAIAQFLNGRYTPVIKEAANAAQDDRVRFVMPTVNVAPNGNVELTITTALAQKAQDASDTLFDPDPPISRDEPNHPRNGLIPAREVYRRLRPHMVADPAAVPLMDAMLVEWPSAPRFLPLRFTRTSEPIANCSAFFPRQTVNIRTGPADVIQERLPAHGVVFVRQEPAPIGQPVPAAPLIEVWLTGTMKWLFGGGTSWRDPGQTTPRAIDLELIANPHISARLPMTQAILSDPSRPRPGGMACTYLSLRRAVRALVDNRIAGGRLNFGVSSTSLTTRGLIQKAFSGTPATVSIVAANAPDPNGDPNVVALPLERVLRAFFQNPAPQVAMAGPPPNPTILEEGAMVYRLWQSILNTFQDNLTKRNFDDAYIGRGAPGAMRSLSLAASHVDLDRNVGESDAAYFDRIVGAMLVGLEPGALLQFWNDVRDFVDIKNRAVPGGDPLNLHSYGHSPIFVRYQQTNAGVVTGLRIIDQFGESSCPVTGAAGSRRIQWHGDNQAVWIAANWTE